MNRMSCALGALALALALCGLQMETGCALAAESGEAAGNPVVLVKTTEGSFKLRLFQDKAPITVKNFLQYVESGFYKGTVFHRVIDGFMIQGGGFTEKMERKETREPIKNEASEVLKNRRGTIAMARTGVVDSATSQFFVNAVDNAALDHRDDTPRGFGYAVFGEVVEGMDVIDRIGKVKTTTVGPYADVPEKPVVIESIERVE